MPGTVLGIRDTAVNKIDKTPCPQGSLNSSVGVLGWGKGSQTNRISKTYSVLDVDKCYGENLSREGGRECNCVWGRACNFKQGVRKGHSEKRTFERTYRSEEISMWEENAFQAEGMVSAKVL